jgi:hypothetical protein
MSIRPIQRAIKIKKIKNKIQMPLLGIFPSTNIQTWPGGTESKIVQWEGEVFFIILRV